MTLAHAGPPKHTRLHSLTSTEPPAAVQPVMLSTQDPSRCARTMVSCVPKMFCCACTMTPACCRTASTTRGWQCPVEVTPMPDRERGAQRGVPSLKEVAEERRQDACGEEPAALHPAIKERCSSFRAQP